MTGDPRKAADPVAGGGEDAEDEDIDMMDVDVDLPPSKTLEPVPLPTRIITPSPYPHHIRGATSARFRNALSRVTTHPTSDSEAWAALLTEVQTCWKDLQPTLHLPSVETQAKLEFLVSCYGALLQYFPYTTDHSLQLGQMLLEASARPGEAGGPSAATDVDVQRANLCEGQLETLLRMTLHAKSGAEFGLLPELSEEDNEEEKKEEDLGFLTKPKSSAEDTAPKADTLASSKDADEELRKVLGGMGIWAVSLWQLYLQKVHRDLKRQARTIPKDDRAKWLQEKMVASYELALEHAGFGYNNRLIWKEYVQYIQSWTDDPQEQTTQLRSVYQRLIQMPMAGLDALWQEYEAFERGAQSNEEVATALLAEYTPKFQHARTVFLERARVYNYTGDLQLGRLATPPVTRRLESDKMAEGADDHDTKETLEDYLNNLQEEYQLLQAWKKRVSYERTNPENLPATELPRRMRHAHLEMISVLTRHPEVWHMWAMYENYHAHKPVHALAVLQLALKHIPDCTLLAHTQAQLVEAYLSPKGGELAIQVLEVFLETAPNTLAFCLYQQLVRRYQGLKAARAVFSRARRVLTGESNKQKAIKKEGEEKEDGKEEGDDSKVITSSSRRMVINRLDQIAEEQPDEKSEATTVAEDTTGGEEQVAAGPITWHLYASHAMMEHRVNHFPQIAARIYELGLRNHPQFLTQPPFVFRYAQLLLELNDTNNLRALLTRAVAAATADEGSAKATVAATLWDMTLQFETLLSGADPMANQLLHEVERKRHMALMGPDMEDVATGGYQLEMGASTTVGAQKSTIGELLIRNDGYDLSSAVVNGMGRSVSVLEVMGLWGSNIMTSEGSSKRGSQPNKTGMEFLEEEENPAERSSGASDASYQKRLMYQRLYESGTMQSGGGMNVGAGAGAGNRARDRLAGGGINAAVSAAIQQQPEWIRPLLLMLPMSRMRLAALARPPPHLTEMALNQLRQCPLPAAPPGARISGQKRPLSS